MLEKEYETYEKHLPALLETDRDKWIVVQGDDFWIYEEEMEALREAYKRFGRMPFMMQQILPEQPIETSGYFHISNP